MKKTTTARRITTLSSTIQLLAEALSLMPRYTSHVMATVMSTATAVSTPIRVRSGAAATVPRAMMMISAERMKSVRIAPLILSRSSTIGSAAGSASTRATTASACSASSSVCSPSPVPRCSRR